MDQYANAERRKTSITTVLVEVDKVENLREAYPNYFLDVRLFTQNVLSALNGGKMIQALHKQDVQRTAYGYDPAWLKQFVSDR
jgi:hypothetical protein